MCSRQAAVIAIIMSNGIVMERNVAETTRRNVAYSVTTTKTAFYVYCGYGYRLIIDNQCIHRRVSRLFMYICIYDYMTPKRWGGLSVDRHQNKSASFSSCGGLAVHPVYRAVDALRLRLHRLMSSFFYGQLCHS